MAATIECPFAAKDGQTKLRLLYIYHSRFDLKVGPTVSAAAENYLY